MSDKRIVEINGVKVEVDLRTAVRVDTLSVGSRVKVLAKEYGGWQTYPGVIIGFEPFKSLPTIVVCYLSTQYNKLNFCSYNAESKDIEIVAEIDQSAIEVEKAGVIASMNRQIEVKRRELTDIEQQKAFFLAKFGAYFTDAKKDNGQ